MSTSKKHVMTAILTGAALMGAVPVFAASQTATNNLSVSASVTRSCTVSASTLDFGSLVVGTPKDASATINIDCTATNSGDTVTVSFNYGANSTGTNRRMSNGSSYIAYVLSAGQGTTELTNSATISTTTNAEDYTATVWGRATAAASNETGSYSDTVVMTVTYDDGA